jgi:ATP-dependent protease ClpP protease subunit
MDIFVYYRVHPEHTELLKSAIFNMQNQLKTHYAIQTSLKRRSDQADQKDYATWMETYQNVPVGFLESLDDAVSKANISAYIEGERHVEVFEDF